MRQGKLTPGSAALLFVGLATALLMGVPDYTKYKRPEGTLTGLVLDQSGTPFLNAEVALFDDESLELVEITRSDERGHFAFDRRLARFSVFASVPEDPSWLGDWILSRDGSTGAEMELHLAQGQAVNVLVEDDQGEAIENAEVRVLDARSDLLVLARVPTDAEGNTTVYLPSRAHVAAMAPGALGLAPRWNFDVETRALEGDALVCVLPRARELGGTVSNAEGEALEGLVVSAWDASGENWSGWTRTDEDGAYRLDVAGSEDVQLRIVDTEHGRLPYTALVARGEQKEDEIVLQNGVHKRLSIGTGEAPIPARVWLREEGSGAWSWGGVTDENGRVDLLVPGNFSIVAVPFDDQEGPLESWDQVATPGSLQLVDERSERQ